MYELIEILAGGAAGAIAAGLKAGHSKVIVVALGCVAAALAAALVSGEVARDPWFLIWDLAQAMSFALLVLVLCHRQTRPARPRAVR